MSTVTVIGNINMGTTLRLADVPEPDEAMHAHEIFHTGGGKDANQAVTAKRSGARTSFIGNVGIGGEGQQLLDLLTEEDIDTSRVVEVQGVTAGQTMITVDAAGKDNILIHAGAGNASREQEILKNKQLITNSDFIIIRFESNLDATTLAFPIARDTGKTTTLNPAPTRETISTELLEKTDVIMPNEIEAEIIIGIRVIDHNSLVTAAERLYELGIGTVIITLGSVGAFYHTEKEHDIIPAFEVNAVDATATGDTFIGTLGSTLQPGLSNLRETILYENLASSIVVQSCGAQPSVPYREALKQSAVQN